MVVRRQKKQRRGERTYHGSHKKWRGGGSRGGRGMAGLHKHKWTRTVKYMPDHFGKSGFISPTSKKIRAINIKDLDQMMEKLVEKKLVAKEGDKIKVDLEKIGYDKLLGSGKATRPFIIEAKYFSKSAVKKVENAGGQVIVKNTQSKN
jgi:large subunit ribosomal protein L15